LSLPRIFIFLLLSAVFAIPGLILTWHAGVLDPRMSALGAMLTWGGMILGTGIVFVLANRFGKGEMRRNEEDRARIEAEFGKDPAMRHQRSRRLNVLWYKNHPGLLLAACLFGLIMFAAMVSFGVFSSDESFSPGNVPPDRIPFITMGSAACLFYVFALAYFLPKYLRGQWNSYWDAELDKIDLKIKRIEERDLTRSAS
jgi:hypothetical protein